MRVTIRVETDRLGDVEVDRRGMDLSGFGDAPGAFRGELSALLDAAVSQVRDAYRLNDTT